MEGRAYNHQVDIGTIDLMRSQFNWRAGASAEDKEAVSNYSAAVQLYSKEEFDTRKTAFAYFTLTRKNYKENNFEISASYFLSIHTSEPSKDRCEGPIKDIVSKIVWARFYSLARVLLEQADIVGVDVPIIPDTVKTLNP